MPRFSVLIPAYQAAKTIRRAVESALQQDFDPQHVEVIVCDDGSTDDLAGALDDLLRREPRLRLIRRLINGGVSVATNRAARDARGEFLVKLDADDEWRGDRLREMARLLDRHPSLDLVTTDAIVVDLDGSRHRYYQQRPAFPPPARQRREIIARNFLFGSAAIRRRALDRIGGFDEAAPHQGEYECWIRLILSGSVAGLVNQPLAIYHRQPDGLSRRPWGRAATIDRALRRLPPGDLTAEERRAVTRRRLRLLPRRALDALSPRWSPGRDVAADQP